MSLYCKGKDCPKADKCLRKEGWDYYSHTFNKTDEVEGYATCVWFIKENECIQNNYEDGVFLDD